VGVLHLLQDYPEIRLPERENSLDFLDSFFGRHRENITNRPKKRKRRKMPHSRVLQHFKRVIARSEATWQSHIVK
jgi:hypothetical protein